MTFNDNPSLAPIAPTPTAHDADAPPGWFPMRRRVHRAVDSRLSDPEVVIGVPFTRAPDFGDQRQADNYIRAFEEQRLRQTTQYVIAPLCSVTTRRGVLTEGTPVTEDDVGGLPVMNLLRSERIVTFVEADIVAVRAAPPSRYQVAASSTCTRRGIVMRGAAVTAADFATDAVPATPARDAHVNAYGHPVHATPAVPGRPASDGTAELQELIRRGVVVDNGEPTPTTNARGSKR
jgi:hypothetical protein